MKIEKNKIESGAIFREKGMARVYESNGDSTLTVMLERGFIRFRSFDSQLELRKADIDCWKCGGEITLYKWENK